MNEERLAKMEAQLERLTRFIDEFEPVVRALLSSIPAGPLKWAMRKAQKP